MKTKLTLLSLGLVAAAAGTMFTAASALATTPAGNHFVSHATEEHLIVKGTDAFGSNHAIEIHGDNDGKFACTDTTYHGTLSGPVATTTQSIQIRPHYTKCATTTGAWGEVDIHVPTACGTNVYEFKSGAPGTLHINCKLTITHVGCTIQIPTQTLSGATYTAIVEGGVQAIALDAAFTSMTAHYESGFCIFLGTNHSLSMTGSLVLWGETTSKRVGLTHT